MCFSISFFLFFFFLFLIALGSAHPSVSKQMRKHKKSDRQERDSGRRRGADGEGGGLHFEGLD